VRGIAEQIDAVVWFSDLRGFTRITDTAPEEMMSLLNDYSDVIICRVAGVQAVFSREDRKDAIPDELEYITPCSSIAALSATIVAGQGVAELNKHRAAMGKPLTYMYLGLHVGNVFYGRADQHPGQDTFPSAFGSCARAILI
jgi:adenylate cyclase